MIHNEKKRCNCKYFSELVNPIPHKVGYCYFEDRPIDEQDVGNCELDEDNEVRRIEMRTWERKGYKIIEVEFDYDLHTFEAVKDGDVVATITPSTIEDMQRIINDLNTGHDINGWEDGLGNTINI